MSNQDWEENYRFLDIKWVNVNDLTELIIRLVLNTLIIFIITHFIYNKKKRKKDFYFSYLAIGLTVFLLCFLLNSVKLQLGFALGLFAVFGIIRYRTDAIPIKEMTYLFVIIATSLINALSNKKISHAELVLTNIVIVLSIGWLEKKLTNNEIHAITIHYEMIENIHKNNKKEFIADLNKRTGLKVVDYEIHRIDFLRDTAEITLFYEKEKATMIPS